MNKSLYEKIFGSWLMLVLVALLVAMAIWTKFNDETYPEPNDSTNQNYTSPES